MRIAVIADVHGNAVALDAVLADAAGLGVDEHWFIGDHAAIGPEPVKVLERITSTEGARFTRGNTDRYVVTGEVPPPSLEAVRTDPSLIPTYTRIAASFAWTRGYVTGCGWLDWLERLATEIRFTGPDGIRILAVHASPGCDDGEGVHPGRSNDEIGALIEGAAADLVLVGHTHEPMVRRIGQTIVVNVGSVSNPRTPDLRACYLILDATHSGTSFMHRRVAYDRDAFEESVLRSRHPSADYILSFQRGEQAGRPPHVDHAAFTAGSPIHVALNAC